MQATTPSPTAEAAISVDVQMAATSDVFLAEVRHDAQDEYHELLRDTIQQLIEECALEPADYEIGAGGRLAFKMGWLDKLVPDAISLNTQRLCDYVAGYLDRAAAELQSA